MNYDECIETIDAELDKCPVCGGKAVIELLEVDYPVTFFELYYRVRCTFCGMYIGHEKIPRMPQFCPYQVEKAKNNLIKMWNKHERCI